MSWTGLDQRAFPRISARCDISIQHSLAGVIKTHTQNVGAGGVCVILQRELEKLSSVHLKLALEDPDSLIECEGRAMWIVRSTDPASRKVSFDTGIGFVGLKPEAEKRLAAFLKTKTQFSGK